MSKLISALMIAAVITIPVIVVAADGDLNQQVKASKQVKLSAKDQKRMKELKKQALKTLKEMDKIVSRNLGMDAKNGIPVFIPQTSSGKLNFDTSTGKVTLHCATGDDGVTYCGCWDEEDGMCGPCNIDHM